jgi:hypothetical protein
MSTRNKEKSMQKHGKAIQKQHLRAENGVKVRIAAITPLAPSWKP